MLLIDTEKLFAYWTVSRVFLSTWSHLLITTSGITESWQLSHSKWKFSWGWIWAPDGIDQLTGTLPLSYPDTILISFQNNWFRNCQTQIRDMENFVDFLKGVCEFRTSNEMNTLKWYFILRKLLTVDWSTCMRSYGGSV